MILYIYYYIYYYSTNPNVSSSCQAIDVYRANRAEIERRFHGRILLGFRWHQRRGPKKVGSCGVTLELRLVRFDVASVLCVEIWVWLQLDGHVSLRVLRCCKKLRSTCIVMVEWTRWDRALRENLSFSVVCFMEFIALKMCFNDPTGYSCWFYQVLKSHNFQPFWWGFFSVVCLSFFQMPGNPPSSRAYTTRVETTVWKLKKVEDG